ncbi:MFS transporter [Acidiferrimicrobium sp. IK]|uniref:MFS transporter n=1 Tax=Acidiferrimicrobium sp. IK TaxID=2871700 RepID=UPI0021CB0097|nr:MFS transporter [Acidiferrimicrobium sp. IK]MCU4184245.1 MFS transporter [Acidiferrimicrobium sp. IK]
MSPPPNQPAAPDEVVADRHRRNVILACCSLSLFIVSLDATVVNVGLPAIQRDLHASVAGLQWTIDAYTLVIASLLLLSGSLGDRFGRRKLFQIGLVIFGIGSLACSLAPNLGSLIAFRMLQAVGGSMLNPNSLSIITSVFTEPKERARAIGVWGGIFGISAASGPIIGGLLIDTIGWRALFWINIPVVVVASYLAARTVPESRAAKPRRLDPPGQLITIALLSSLTFAIIEGPDHGWTSPLIAGLFAVAAVSMIALVTVERRRLEPLLEVRFFRSPPFSGAATIATLAFLILAGFLFLNTLYLQEVRGDSALMAGVSTLPATIVIAVVAPLSGRMVAARGSRVPLTGAGVLLAGGALVLAADRATSPYLLLAVGYLLLGLGFGLVNPPITNTAVAGMPQSQSGVAAAVASTSRQTGNVLGVALVGSLVTTRFHRLLAPRLAPFHLPAATHAALLHSGIGATGLHLPGGAGGALAAAVDSAFTVASHAGWYLAAGCGIAISLVAAVTTGPKARAAAARVMREA